MDLVGVPRPAPTCSQGHNNDEEIPMTLLTTSNTKDRLERQPETPTVVAEAQSPLTLPIALKLGSAAFAFFVAGVNDGSLGALLPYALRGYHISTGSVAILYGTAFAGWVVAALIGGYVRAYIGSGGALVLGASSQLVAFALRVWVSLATANWLE
jgi:fucose permease